MKIQIPHTLSLTALLLSALSAQAWQVTGEVRCPNGITFKDVIIDVTGTTPDGPFSTSAATDASGQYFVALPETDGSYVATINTSTLPQDATVESPLSVPFVITGTDFEKVANWVIGGAACDQGVCWFTGGGTRIDQILGIPVAEKGQKNSFGGNVNPGCSPTAGDGGNWNHVARDLKLHFQGRTIRVVRCGNVEPPPGPGSSSPKTPFNFIEWVGEGTLKGIQGNKANYGAVTFFARTEDRNEPGAKDGNAGALIDRYFLKVVDAGGVTRLLIDADGVDDGQVDPSEITSGNFQLHISSCDNPPN
jgi:hypothetical protein